MAEPNQRFFSACRTGKIDVVRKCLEGGLDPNSLDKYSMTGLINAGRKGRVEIARVLYLCGADLDIGDVRNRTALFHAVCFGHVDFVRAILEFDANFNTVDVHGWTPLDMARSEYLENARSKSLGIVTLLEQVGAKGKPVESSSKVFDVESKSDKVRSAMGEKISKRIGENHDVEYCCFVENDEGVIVDNLDQVAINDLVVFVAEPDDCWDDDAQGAFQSPCLDLPTWMDLCVTLQEQISFSSDTGHIAFEDILHTGTMKVDGKRVQIYQFVLGS